MQRSVSELSETGRYHQFLKYDDNGVYPDDLQNLPSDCRIRKRLIICPIALSKRHFYRSSVCYDYKCLALFKRSLPQVVQQQPIQTVQLHSRYMP